MPGERVSFQWRYCTQSLRSTLADMIQRLISGMRGYISPSQKEKEKKSIDLMIGRCYDGDEIGSVIAVSTSTISLLSFIFPAIRLICNWLLGNVRQRFRKN